MWSKSIGDIHSWISAPTETMQRASHVIQLQGESYCIEPVDHPRLDADLETVAPIAGVIVLMDRHCRDSERVAERHDCPVFAPESFDRIERKLEESPEPLAPLLAESDFVARSMIERTYWQECALWRSRDRTLIVPEALGTAPYFRTRGERIGVHPFLRLMPPRDQLRAIPVERLFVGHGRPIDDVRPEEIDHVLEHARRKLPQAWLRAIASSIR